MIQLLQKNINTIQLTNTVLRNTKNENHNEIIYVPLRTDNINVPNFIKLDVFKNLSLDLARQVNAEIITDIGIILIPSGKSLNLEDCNNRLILIMENTASFEHDDKRFVPEAGDLLWLNEKISINNTGLSSSIIFVLDFKEFLL